MHRPQDNLEPLGKSIDLDDMRGRPMLIVAGDPVPSMPRLPGLTLIRLSQERSARPTGDDCAAAGADTWTALAILLGVSPERLSGVQILVDSGGWLRARSVPGLAGGWIGDTAALAAALDDVEAHPVQLTAGHHHH